MSVSKIIIKHYDPQQNMLKETLGTSLKANIDTDTATTVINWARGFVQNLTKDSYQGVEISETTDLDALVAN